MDENWGNEKHAPVLFFKSVCNPSHSFLKKNTKVFIMVVCSSECLGGNER